MRTVLGIAAGELSFLRRSMLARMAAFALVFLAVASAATSAALVSQAAEQRAHHQVEADEAFRAQPDRHPHRMVHYGHYVYRVPPPLALVDPGVDAYTGTSLFLEGHRQNTATFSDVREMSNLTRFGALTPAFSLQVLVPLLLILIGYSCVTRERERGTLLLLLSHGAGGWPLLAGKSLALGALALTALIPLAVVTFRAAAADAVLPSVMLFAGYAVYLAFWIALVVCVSTFARSARAALIGVLSLWVMSVVIVPRASTDFAVAAAPVAPQIESDLAVQRELRRLGDSHNANDSNFAGFRARVLAQYDVDRIEDLPLNFRGLVAYEGEAQTTDVLNAYAAERMETEFAQARIASRFSLLSPMLALRQLSMISAGTDLANHHRFLKAAEAHRFEFVQALNQLQTKGLTYADDVARSRDTAAERRTRVSADNWTLLPTFEFEPAPAVVRVERALVPMGVLLVWAGGLLLLFVRTARRITV